MSVNVGNNKSREKGTKKRRCTYMEVKKRKEKMEMKLSGEKSEPRKNFIGGTKEKKINEGKTK